jgi:hypothetical protein
MASGKVVRYFLETTNTGDPSSGNRVVTEGERRQYGNTNDRRQKNRSDIESDTHKSY